MAKKGFLYQGAIPTSEVTDLLAQHAANNSLGAYNLFLGQVRNDLIDDKRVAAIEFTSYEEMAENKTKQIIGEVMARHKVDSIRVLQSVGTIKAGEICLLVLACSAHRKAAIDACQEMVERFKAEVPVWGRELFEDDSYQWKVNTVNKD